jgi:Flp pilus assembly protein TadB
MSQPPEDNLKALWQGQEPETPAMTVQAIRLLVAESAARQRAHLFIGWTVSTVVACIFLGCAWTAPTPLVRLGDLVMLGWLPVMVLIFQRQRPGRAPGTEASVQGLLDFYRGEVLRQAPDLRLTFLSMAPLAAGMAVILLGIWQKAPALGLPTLFVVLAMSAFWGGMFALLLRRTRRRIARRLSDIDAMRG